MLIEDIMGGHLPKMIMLDLDGTLVDSVPSLSIAINKMMSELQGPLMSEASVRGWVGNGAAVLVERALSSVGMESSYSQAYEFFLSSYRECLSNDLIAYPRVHEFLDLAKGLGIQLAIVTNKPTQFTLPVLKSVNLDKYFETLICGDTYSERKPSPLPLIRLIERFDLHHSDVLMVGDSIHDKMAAERAVVEFCGVSYGYNHGEALKAKWVVDNLVSLFK